MPVMDSLAEIAKTFNANKTDYLVNVYPRYFEPLRHFPLKVLELGVHKGGSLEMWARYFANARVVGLDLGEVAPDAFSTDRIRYVTARQEDAEVLSKLSDEEAPEGWDIIIDDCAHSGAPALASFQILFPRLRVGGFYTIEDWGTGYWPDWEDGAELARSSHFRLTDGVARSHQAGIVGFVKQLVDEAGIDDVRRRRSEIRPSMFEFVHISLGLVVTKKANAAPSVFLE